MTAPRDLRCTPATYHRECPQHGFTIHGQDMPACYRVTGPSDGGKTNSGTNIGIRAGDASDKSPPGLHRGCSMRFHKMHRSDTTKDNRCAAPLSRKPQMRSNQLTQPMAHNSISSIRCAGDAEGSVNAGLARFGAKLGLNGFLAASWRFVAAIAFAGFILGR